MSPDLASRFFDLSAVAEVALVAGAVLALVAWRRRWRLRLDIDRPTGLALAGIVVMGVVLRTLWAGDLVTPTHHAGLMSVLTLNELATQHPASDLFWHWWQRMHVFQSLSLIWISAFRLPIDLTLFRLVGPSAAFPAIDGAAWGVLATLLAFGIGRRLGGPALGLAFAALLTVSPVQITWSRVGGIYVGAVPHVLGAVWLAMVALGRRSVVAALLAGVWSWMSLYDYYPARLAIPLGAWTLLTVRADGVRPLDRAAFVSAYALPFFAGFALLTNHDLLETFWPLVGLQFFPNPEAGPVLDASLQGLWARAADTLRLLFVTGREFSRDWVYGLGARHGGAVLLPVALLGLVGIARALRHPWRQQLVLVLLVTSLLPAVFSHAELRRLLVFDAAWCLVAGLGVVILAELLAGWGLVARRLVAAGAYLGLALWSFGTVLALAAVPQPEITAMPFGLGEQSEGITCNGCSWRVRRWRDAVRNGAAVVVLDGDAARDGRQFHLRTEGYAALASLGAGHEDAVTDFYDLLPNVRRPRTWPPGRYWEEGGGWEDVLRERLSRPGVERIVWVFTTPTQLERQAVARLEQVGGRVERVHFPFDASATLGPERQAELGGWMLEVTIPPDRLDDALAAVRDTLAPPAELPAEPNAVQLGRRSVADLPMDVEGTLGPDGRPVWTVALPSALDVHGTFRPSEAPAAIGAGGLLALSRSGRSLELAHVLAVSEPDRTLPPVGTRCAALVGGAWLVVDPVTGALRGEVDTSWLPALPWTGITAAGDELVLASATGELVVADVARRRVTGRWRMPIWRGRTRWYGDCSTVLIGDGWYASYDYDGSLAAFVDRNGVPLGTLDLRVAIGDPTAEVEAVGAVGGFLGVANRSRLGFGIDTLQVFPPAE